LFRAGLQVASDVQLLSFRAETVRLFVVGKSVLFHVIDYDEGDSHAPDSEFDAQMWFGAR
jgi:hypothetical protein